MPKSPHKDARLLRAADTTYRRLSYLGGWLSTSATRQSTVKTLRCQIGHPPLQKRWC